VAHVEAGLRSFDRTMPEEINRIATDALSTLLLTPSLDANENLMREGRGEEAIYFVGNVMIDSLLLVEEESQRAPLPAALLEREGSDRDWPNQGWGVLTLHRTANVDTPEALWRCIEVIKTVTSTIPLVFPLHPRTRANLIRFDLLRHLEALSDLILTPPLTYPAFMGLIRRAQVVITDSGGVQEESSYLGIPCLTLRDSTERPVTISHGTNRLTTFERIGSEVKHALDTRLATPPVIPLWDGRAAGRVVDALERFFG
jgi:UDP-N-acetylglucosamine 2-epimerase (non-hydrolysing)